jgi:hypothetical protein
MSVPLPVQSTERTEEPSLAELARRTREGKAENTSKVDVITNADLEHMRDGNVGTGTAPARKRARTRPEEAELTFEDWELAFDDARTRLIIVINQIRALQVKLGLLRAGFHQAGNWFQRSGINPIVDATFVELRQAYEDESALRDEIEQLRRDAFRSGLTWRQVDDLIGTLPESPANFEPLELE